METAARGNVDREVDISWNNPIAPDRLFAVLDVAGVVAGDRVLDLGCGSGELLLALARRGVTGVGIDNDPTQIFEGQQAAAGLDVHLLSGDATTASLQGDFSLVCCIGATHAFGDGASALTAALQAAREYVRPGGYLLVGEGYHRQTLPAEYVRFLGEPSGIKRTHADNIDVCEGLGLPCVHAITASVPEWDDFEWALFRRRRAAALQLPVADQDAALANVHAWREAWLQWGRDTMGFGLYLLEA